MEIACLRYCDCSDYKSTSNPYRYTLIDSGLDVSRVQGYPTKTQPFNSRHFHTGSHLPGTCLQRQTVVHSVQVTLQQPPAHGVLLTCLYVAPFPAPSPAAKCC